jgi:hypothetical protein
MGWFSGKELFLKDKTHKIKKRILNSVSDKDFVYFNKSLKEGLEFKIDEKKDQDLWENNKTYYLYVLTEKNNELYERLLESKLIEYKYIKNYIIMDYNKMKISRHSWRR